MTKTRSLTLAPDPVARMREIHDLDNPPPVSPTVPDGSSKEALQHENASTQKQSNVETPPQRSAEAPERGNTHMPEPISAETQKPENIEAQQQSNTETQQHRNTATKKQSRQATLPDAPISENPVREAMRQALIQPYAADLSKGPSTATTIRIPTEIWERLDMASTLESQTKQDIIAEALKVYLKKIGRGEV
jgi:hypothetical protein